MAGGALDEADRMSATFLTKNSAKSSTEWPDVDAAVGGRSRTLSLVHITNLIYTSKLLVSTLR